MKLAEEKANEIREILIKIASYSQSEKEAENLVSFLVDLHPSHQQSIGRFIQKVIVFFDEKKKKGHYDRRNEAVCNMCSKIDDEIKFNSYLPFI